MSKKTKKQTAKVIIFNKKGEVLILRTAKKGLWDLPGGNRDKSDKTILECALREIKEETGLKPKRLSSVGSKIIEGKKRHLYIGKSSSVDIEIDQREHRAFEWVPNNKIPYDQLKPKVQVLLRVFEKEAKRNALSGKKKKQDKMRRQRTVLWGRKGPRLAA